MLIRKKAPRELGIDEPLKHPDHRLPVTRRQMIAQGFRTGSAVIAAPTLMGLFASNARGAVPLSQYMQDQKAACGIVEGAGKIPFIAFDLAGGANMVGSEILIGGQGGQLDFLSTAGYAKLGLPGDMVPNAPNAASATNNFIDTSFGAAWHSDGAFLRGMLEKTSTAARANTNSAVIAARSENDTGNNPHNPMYAIARAAGSDGSLMTLIGSRASDSGGNSMAPLALIDPSIRPAKIDRTSDVTGLVDTGKLVQLLGEADAVAVLESMATITENKLGRVSTGLNLTRDEAVEKLVQCGYIKTVDNAATFGNPASLNPELDTNIVGPSGIFTQAEFDSDGEFEKTAAVMKMVINGFAGAGTITMGGYDYHGQGRATGEQRNLRAGRCIGACIEYAHRVQKPVMIYVFSDGSLSASNMVDTTPNGRGKFMWVSDNQSTAASFFLVYNPQGRPAVLTSGGGGAARHQQLGYFTPDGSVASSSSPAANAVNLLVQTVVLNYMALHGESGQFPASWASMGAGNHGLGADLDSMTAFGQIVPGVITS